MKFNLRPKLAGRILLTLSFLSVTAAGFQNCSGVTYGSKTVAKPQNSGNGDGYTGKVYVEFGTCGTETQAVKAKIQAVPELDQYTLMREDCADLASGQKLDPASVVKSNDLKKLTYKSRDFVLYDKAPRIDAAGPFGPIGRSIALSGANLCGPAGFAVGEITVSGPKPFGIMNAACLAGGTLLTFDPPTSFYGRTEPAVAFRLVNLALPSDLNWADFSLSPAEMFRPKVFAVSGLIDFLSGRDMRITGEFFGDCGANTTVTLTLGGGTTTLPTDIVACSDHEIRFMAAGMGGAVQNLPPGTRLNVSNGIKTTSVSLL
jgi:hypothetical protein